MLAHREIGDCRDAQLSEVARWADSGAQKDRSAAVGPCGEDYLPGGVDVPGRADDSGRGCAVEEHLVDYDLADDGVVGLRRTSAVRYAPAELCRTPSTIL